MSDTNVTQRFASLEGVRVPLFILSLLTMSSCNSYGPATAEPPRPKARIVEPAKVDPLQELSRIEPPSPPEIDAEPSADEAEIQFRAAAAFYRGKKYGHAASAFKEVVSLDRRRLDAHYYLGVSLLSANEFEAAIPVLRSLSAKPSGEYAGEARLLLAKAYIGARDFQAARDLLREIDTPDAQQLLTDLDRLQPR